MNRVLGIISCYFGRNVLIRFLKCLYYKEIAQIYIVASRQTLLSNIASYIIGICILASHIGNAIALTIPRSNYCTIVLRTFFKTSFYAFIPGYRSSTRRDLAKAIPRHSFTSLPITF